MTRKRLRFLAPLLAATLVAAAACDSGDGDGPEDPAGDGEFPRNETLYTTGTEWAQYDNWNPIRGGGQATGNNGLMYESLFMFNPHTATLDPWLAEGGEWVEEDVFEIYLREGITWTDDEPFTAEDVVFTLDLREIPEVPYSDLTNYVDSVEAVDDLTVRVTFSEPRAGEWNEWLYSREIVPQHLWQEKADAGAALLDEPGDDVRVGTGAFTYNSSTEERVVWERNDSWWAIDALGLDMAMRYIVDFKNAGNEVVIPQIQNAEIDLSNNFLPVEVVRDDDQIEAYRDEEPYMIAWNTAMLLPNNTREPMDDAEFRRALAFAINVDDIVASAYAGLTTASDPTGLLPTWTEQGLVDQAVVGEHGFSYDPAQAESILDAAGYARDGDFRTTPSGDPIELTLVVPAGWNDWNIAADIIAENFQAVGLNVVTDFPEASVVDEMREAGEYDLMVNNWTDLGSTPWTLYNYLFRQPIQEIQQAQNFHRYEDEQAWDLVQDLGALAVGDPAMNGVLSQLQEIALTEMPAIPMWYNGLWAQWNTTVWTNWPKAPDGPYPSTWNNLWEKTAVLMLAQLEPVG